MRSQSNSNDTSDIWASSISIVPSWFATAAPYNFDETPVIVIVSISICPLLKFMIAPPSCFASTSVNSTFSAWNTPPSFENAAP